MGKSSRRNPQPDRSISSLKEAIRRLNEEGTPVTAREVADLCGVELKTVHNWVAQGLLSHFRTPGRHLRFQPEAVLRFLQRCGYVPQALSRRAPARVIALAPKRRQGAIGRALRGADLVWAKSPFALLILAGRTPRAAICLHADSMAGFPSAAAVRTLREELPEMPILWMGPARGLKRSSVTVVGRDDYDAIAGIIAAL